MQRVANSTVDSTLFLTICTLLLKKCFSAYTVESLLLRCGVGPLNKALATARYINASILYPQETSVSRLWSRKVDSHKFSMKLMKLTFVADAELVFCFAGTRIGRIYD